jgi:hypothetical protein
MASDGVREVWRGENQRLKPLLMNWMEVSLGFKSGFYCWLAE